MTQWNAHDYNQHSSEQQKWANELIDKLNLTGDEHLLDVGCGDGKVSAAIAGRLARGKVVGVDKSREMIDFACANFSAPNLSFAQCDASSLKFDAEFDVVFSNAVLHWIVDHRPVLDGIFRALKPGGRVLLQMGGRGNAADVLVAATELTRDPKWREYFTDFHFHYGFYGRDEYGPWLQDAGLIARRVELIPKDMTHNSTDAFAGWIRTTWVPWIQAVPEARRGEFLEAFVSRYVRAHPPDPSGAVHVKMVRLEVEAGR
jgi:trans-aconitate 2-methyltransferase